MSPSDSDRTRSKCEEPASSSINKFIIRMTQQGSRLYSAGQGVCRPPPHPISTVRRGTYYVAAGVVVLLYMLPYILISEPSPGVTSASVQVSSK